jgi:tRNA (cytidine/uridine-2'-O-)-methyltransferase
LSESLSRARKKIFEPALHIILFEPEIPANTGNIARLCAAAELPLHLIHPLGFKTDDRHLKRAGLDYWSEVEVHEHIDFAAFNAHWNAAAKTEEGPAPILAFSARAATSYAAIDKSLIRRGSGLLFGPETRGLPQALCESFPGCRIPIRGRVRSLNLSTAVGIVSYHFLLQLGVL